MVKVVKRFGADIRPKLTSVDIAANVRFEPRVTDAARSTNDGYAQKATFAKSRERPKITARVGPARCDAASPKQTLMRCCSIIEVLRSAVRDKVAVRCTCKQWLLSRISTLSWFRLQAVPWGHAHMLKTDIASDGVLNAVT